MCTFSSIPTLYIRSSLSHGELAKLVFDNISNGVYSEHEQLDCEFNVYVGEAFGFPASLYVIEGWDQIAEQYPYELFLLSHAGPEGHEVDPAGVDKIIEVLLSVGLTLGVTNDIPGMVDDLRLCEYSPRGEVTSKVIRLV